MFVYAIEERAIMDHLAHLPLGVREELNDDDCPDEQITAYGFSILMSDSKQKHELWSKYDQDQENQVVRIISANEEESQEPWYQAIQNLIENGRNIPQMHRSKGPKGTRASGLGIKIIGGSILSTENGRMKRCVPERELETLIKGAYWYPENWILHPTILCLDDLSVGRLKKPDGWIVGGRNDRNCHLRSPLGF